MSQTGGVSYQIFQTYYDRAVSAERQGHAEEARKMYLLASEALLRAAKEVSGETKAALVRRADKLERIAKSIRVEPAASAPKKVEAPSDARERQSEDESRTLWQSAGKPNVRFDDIAGLAEAKESIQRRVILPRLHPEVYETFRRKVNGGILFYGPPGTGKTMLAKAIATEVDAEFFSVRCSDIVGKYFGEAEKNVKGLFEAARSARSAVLFFDEFEALASQRGGNSTVMNRLVPELLSQMDGFSVSDDASLLFLAATNRPWDIDSAFLRPPRLTEKIYIGLPDFEARLFLVSKALKGVPRDEDVTDPGIAERTQGYNAADVVAFCEALKDGAIERTIRRGQTEPITAADVEATLQRVHSSVHARDIEQIRKWEAKMGM